MKSSFILILVLWNIYRKGLKITCSDSGPDYMSRAGPVSRAASVCRDDFQPRITWGEPARLKTDAMNRGKPERAWFCLSLA